MKQWLKEMEKKQLSASSCPENRSKKVTIPIFAVLNMYEPALEKENKTDHLVKMPTQYNVNTSKKKWNFHRSVHEKLMWND